VTAVAPPRVLVVGGGVTGLSVAVTLLDEARALGLDLDLTLLEAGPTLGGHARTVADEGFLVEAGPNGFLDREPETLALVESLGLQSRIVEARPTRRRFVVRDGRLCLVPDSPWTLLASDALSVRGRLRVLLEPVARGPRNGRDETVYEFARRRLGREAADILVDAAVAGISAGDSRVLSARAQFPRMVQMEREHGSLFRALLVRRRRGARKPRLRSFAGGMATLVGALSARVGVAARLNTPVRRVDRRGDGQWRIEAEGGDTLDVNHVVLATPASVAARVLQGLDPDLCRLLERIPFAGVSVVALAYRVADVPRARDGYAYLVTQRERLATIGVVVESSLFPGRAPDGMVLLRVFLGGTRHPHVAQVDPDAAVALARKELARVLDVHAPPVRAWIFRWPEAIAQYTVGHLERVAAIRVRLEQHDGLDLCGTSYDGLSFNDAVATGRRTGRSVIAHLIRQQSRPIAPTNTSALGGATSRWSETT
jgi:oxygen-dependent protoporphyrinogen oxidase